MWGARLIFNQIIYLIQFPAETWEYEYLYKGKPGNKHLGRHVKLYFHKEFLLMTL